MFSLFSTFQILPISQNPIQLSYYSYINQKWWLSFFFSFTADRAVLQFQYLITHCFLLSPNMIAGSVQFSHSVVSDSLWSHEPQLEKAMAPHSSTLDWNIPRREEAGRLQSMGSLKVGHDWSDLAEPQPPCPSPTPRVYPNPCSWSRWCHPTISSSVVPFSSRLQSFPASGSFQMNQLFASGGQSIEVSASTSVLLMNIEDWSPLGWIGWISLQSNGLSRVFSNTTVQKHQFFGAQLSL